MKQTPYILPVGEQLRIHITKTSKDNVLFSIYDKDGELVSNNVSINNFVLGVKKLLSDKYPQSTTPTSDTK